METFLTIIHVLACVIMILVILLQPGKSGMGAIGGGVGATSFGPKQQTTILTKVTVAVAAIFMATSMSLAWLSTRDHSVISDSPAPEAEAAVDEEAAAADEATPAGTEPAGESAPAETAPEGEAAPVEGGPEGEAAPTETAPEGEAAPTETAPEGEAAPAETAPEGEAAPAEPAAEE